ncbi:MAG: LysE/ArgO family amino acid transporter [Oleiphilaceae bacterium]|nr:LysE/ArgO family amino acid transporter [Oleiphilaceae bacterium]
MSAILTGFSLGLSLILAIGAQNAFVLKQGLKKEHVFVSCFICALSDAILISAGVFGFGALVTTYPQIESFARYGGAIFLLFYGLSSFYSACTVKHELTESQENTSSILTTILTCLAFTWLNPHVYLDTVVLLGSISTQYGELQYWFGFGAVIASFTFFFSLGYGARFLRPIFAQAKSWQVLEVIIGVIMLSLALSLVI